MIVITDSCFQSNLLLMTRRRAISYILLGSAALNALAILIILVTRLSWPYSYSVGDPRVRRLYATVSAIHSSLKSRDHFKSQHCLEI